MKRWKVVFLVFLLGMTAACGSTNHAADMAVPDAVKSTLLLPPDPEPEFELTPLSEERSYTAEDGTVVAECSYQLVTMRVSNADELSPETAAQAERAARAYKDINLLAMKLLRPGGKLFTFSCSGAMKDELFGKVVDSAACDAKADFRITGFLGQGPDHPVSAAFPEGRYLKGITGIRL